MRLYKLHLTCEFVAYQKTSPKSKIVDYRLPGNNLGVLSSKGGVAVPQTEPKKYLQASKMDSDQKIPVLKALAVVGCLQKVDLDGQVSDFMPLVAHQLNLTLDAVRFIWVGRNYITHNHWKEVLTEETVNKIETDWRVLFLHRRRIQFNQATDKNGNSCPEFRLISSKVPKPSALIPPSTISSSSSLAALNNFRFQTWEEFIQERMQLKEGDHYYVISSRLKWKYTEDGIPDLWEVEKELVRFLGRYESKLFIYKGKANSDLEFHCSSSSSGRVEEDQIEVPPEFVKRVRCNTFPTVVLERVDLSRYKISSLKQRLPQWTHAKVDDDSNDDTQETTANPLVDDNDDHQIQVVSSSTPEGCSGAFCKYSAYTFRQRKPGKFPVPQCVHQKMIGNANFPAKFPDERKKVMQKVHRDQPKSDKPAEASSSLKPPKKLGKTKKRRTKKKKKKVVKRKRHGKLWADIVRLYGGNNSATPKSCGEGALNTTTVVTNENDDEVRGEIEQVNHSIPCPEIATTILETVQETPGVEIVELIDDEGNDNDIISILEEIITIID